MARVDPLGFTSHASPATLLFQFANQDNFVPKDIALQFYDVVSEQKQVKWYDAIHTLKAHAQRDRDEWLAQQLGL